MADKIIYNDAATYGKDDYYLYGGRARGLVIFLNAGVYSQELTSIWLKLANRGSPVGILTVQLYRAVFTDSEWKPTGDLLAIGTFPQGSVGTVVTGSDWWPSGNYGALYEITLSPSPVVDPSVTYIFVITATYSGLYNSTALLLSLPAQWAGIGIVSGSIYTGSEWQNWIVTTTIFQLYANAVIPRNPARPDADLPDFPADRPDGYAPDDFWIPGEWNDDVYTPPEWSGPTPGRYFATGGGRWGQQLVAVGHGLIYYEELT